MAFLVLACNRPESFSLYIVVPHIVSLWASLETREIFKASNSPNLQMRKHRQKWGKWLPQYQSCGLRAVFFLLEGHCGQEMNVNDITFSRAQSPGLMFWVYRDGKGQTLPLRGWQSGSPFATFYWDSSSSSKKENKGEHRFSMTPHPLFWWGKLAVGGRGGFYKENFGCHVEFCGWERT